MTDDQHRELIRRAEDLKKRCKAISDEEYRTIVLPVVNALRELTSRPVSRSRCKFPHTLSRYRRQLEGRDII